MSACIKQTVASHPKFPFTPTFIFCSPICSNNCGVIFLWKYILVFIFSVHIWAVEQRVISRKLKYIFTKKTTPQLLEHIGLQNIKVEVKTNFGRLATIFQICLMDADILSSCRIDSPACLITSVLTSILLSVSFCKISCLFWSLHVKSVGTILGIFFSLWQWLMRIHVNHSQLNKRGCDNHMTI